MNVLQLTNVSKSYGVRQLFKEATLTFSDTDRLGLIGINGTGKSTFLRLLSGEISPDTGTVQAIGRATVYYMPQNPTFDEEASVLENVFLADQPLLQLVRAYEHAVRHAAEGPSFMKLLSRMEEEGGWEVEQQAKAMLPKLGLSDFDQPVKELSGGQRRRLALAQALLYPCDLLLLDEPTNHLDEEAIQWLEEFLKSRKGGLLVSTHDRYFLDAISNGILELDRGKFFRYEGNYEKFMMEKNEREEREAATEEKRRQFLKREIEWVRRGALARTTKQKARLERYEKLAAMEKNHRSDAVQVGTTSARLGKTIFDMEHLSFSFEDKAIVKDFTYHMVRHDRIGIVGPNGIGKSTFMKLLDGTLIPSSGTLGKGETVQIAHFEQELPAFDEDMRVLDYIRENRRHVTLSDGMTVSAGQMLERFLFPAPMHGQLIRKLSGGEKRRLYLLKLLMDSPNVLLLDEPTNDLDIPTLEVLEEFLDSFTGVVITVCHDRYFLDRVVDKLFVFSGDGKVEVVVGSYSDWKEKEAANGQEIEVKTKKSSKEVESPAVETSIASASKGLTLGEEEEFRRIEAEMPRIALLIKGLDAFIAALGSDFNKMKEVLKEREEAHSQLEEMEMRWLELEEKRG